MKALAFATAVSLSFAMAVSAQDLKASSKSSNLSKQPTEAAANVDVAAIQKKIDEFTEAINREPRNDAYYGARGDGYQRLRKFDLAISDLSRAIELNPVRQAYYLVRGNAFGKQGRYRESFSDYSKALVLGPKTHNIFLMQGKAAFLAHDYKAALVAGKNAADLKKDDQETLVLLGGAEQKIGLYQDSLIHLSRAIEKNPLDSGVLEMRSNVYRLLGKEDLANADLKRAKELGLRP